MDINTKENEEVKPVVIFTTFWNANKIIGNIEDKSNVSVHSIALSHPNLSKLPNLEEPMDEIDCFCPTKNLLYKYKDDKDWDTYTEGYENILKNRKDKIRRWVDTLEPNRIYILCCWENTSQESICHRKLLYDAFNSSSYTRDKITTVYKNGNE